MTCTKKILSLFLCGMLCVSAFTACNENPKKTDTTAEPSVQPPSLYLDLTPDELYNALLTADQYQLIAYTKQTKPSDSKALLMTRKVLNRDGDRLYTKTETYDGTDAARTVLYADLGTQRTYEQNDGEWEFRNISSTPMNLKDTVEYTLDISDVFPWEQLLKTDNYDVADPDSSGRSMSATKISSWLEAKESAISYSYDENTSSYTVSADATISKLKYSLTFQISFLPQEVALPDAGDKEAYPTPIPSDLYQRMTDESRLSISITGNGYDYNLLKSGGQSVKIDLASRNKVYYYHLNSYEYYTLSSQGWHKIFAQSTPRMADVLAKLKLTEDLSILQPANYDFPAPSDTQLNLSKEALAASSLASCSYTYDKLNREYQFAITPVDCDEPYVLRIRFYGDNVKLPGADLYTDVNVPPARLKQELYSSNNYRISVFDENGGSVYTADYSNESFKLTDHQTGETVYYDGAFIGFKLMYTLVDGNWVRTEIPISDLYQHILKEIGLDKDYFFDDTRYSSLEFLPEGEAYRCTSLPKGIDAITIRCDGRIYEYEITPTVEAPYRVRIEFSDDIWVTLP